LEAVNAVDVQRVFSPSNWRGSDAEKAIMPKKRGWDLLLQQSSSQTKRRLIEMLGFVRFQGSSTS
jgi:hypothetical protein